jgi:hypothetical protein
VRGQGLELAVEVYNPLEWDGLWGLLDDLKDLLKNLDLPCLEAAPEALVP